MHGYYFWLKRFFLYLIEVTLNKDVLGKIYSRNELFMVLIPILWRHFILLCLVELQISEKTCKYYENIILF